MNERDLEHALRQIERATTELWTRAPAVLTRNERGGSSARDGFPAGSMGGGAAATILHCFAHAEDNCECGENVPIPAPSDPTGNAASSKPMTDPLDNVARSVRGYLDESVKLLQRAVSAVALGEHLANPDRRSNPPEHCQACGRLVYCTTADPIRAGYCDACRKAWGRYSDAERAEGREPDRVKFQALRAKEQAA